MKRHKKIWCLALAAMFALSGCGQPSEPEDAQTSSAGETPADAASQETETQQEAGDGEKTVIRFENHGANKNELFADFQTNTQDWEASLWSALAVDDAPDIITHISQSKIPQYADAGHLMDLTSWNCASFIGSSAYFGIYTLGRYISFASNN